MVSPDHKVAPTQIGKKRQKYPKNSTFCSVGGHKRRDLDNQPLDFHQMILIKVFRAHNGVSRSLSGPPTTK